MAAARARRLRVVQARPERAPEAFRDITREEVVLLIREFFDRYGTIPRQVDWDPSAAIRNGFEEAAKRFDQDACWPRYSVVRRLFGSFSEAIIAAGFFPRQNGRWWRETPEEDRAYYLREAVRQMKAHGTEPPNPF